MYSSGNDAQESPPYYLGEADVAPTARVDAYQIQAVKERYRVHEQRRLTQYHKSKPEKVPQMQCDDVVASVAKMWNEENDYAPKMKKTFARRSITAKLDVQNDLEIGTEVRAFLEDPRRSWEGAPCSFFQ